MKCIREEKTEEGWPRYIYDDGTVDEPVPCEVCGGEGVRDYQCSCWGRSVGYECGRCGNCGYISGPCADCDEDGYVLVNKIIGGHHD